jgi:hypothetical protein
MLVGVSDNDKCVNDTMVSVCMRVSLQLLSFKLSSGYLFSPHHVNQGVLEDLSIFYSFLLRILDIVP